MKLYFITVNNDDVYKLLTAESDRELLSSVRDDELHTYARTVFDKLGIPQPIGGFDMEELNERNVVMNGWHATIHITTYEEAL